jgi:eukaryotic-like serine/threonine-protein kinase
MGNFFGELKRRKVLRVAAAYIVSSWVLLQVADVLADILELPVWAPKLIFLILIVGFVPTLILSWAFDVTPAGVRTDDGESGKGPIVVALLLVVAGLVAGGWWYSGKDVRWARDTAIPQIEALLENGDSEAAYAIALRVEATIPGDPVMAEVWKTIGWRTSIQSVPPGATVYRRAYDRPDLEWQTLGQTPLHDIHVPFGVSRLRIEAEGYLPLLRVIGGGLQTALDLPLEEPPGAGLISVNPEKYVLETEDTLPAGFVRVPGWTALLDGQLHEFRDFFLGRYEVTNSEYQQFVEAGGYRRRDLWQHTFMAASGELSFDEAMSLFVDSTGRPGPGTWVGGTYPAGKDDYPVAGVSWYEAAAYARFAGYELPTIHHWRRAFAVATLAWELPASNVGGEQPIAVGESAGLGWTGTFDMLGNVREWCLNTVPDEQRAIVGGAWDDTAYMIENSISIPHALAPMDRSSRNGMRLAATKDEGPVVRLARAPVAGPEPTVIPDPVSDEVFAAQLSNFDYDHSELNAVIEETIEFRHWSRQRVTIDTSDGADRIPVYVYLPTRESSRHSAVMYWPGAASFVFPSIEQTRFQLDFIVRNGRAVVMPVLDGMYERRGATWPDWSTHSGRDLAIEEVREFRRVIDYLESRPDMDIEKLGYSGYSWGGRVGAIVLAVEERIKVGILNQAGINPDVHADIDVVHFLPHVTTPVLHFSGRYDTDFRFETSSKPFFDRLGTPDEHKRHVVEPTGHFVSPAVVKGETLGWLDKYLGPVE